MAVSVALAEAFPPQNLVKVQVVTRQFKPASLRSLGGTELVLQVGGLDIPQRLLIGDVGAALLKPGDMLVLRLAPGRFVTAWQATPSAHP